MATTLKLIFSFKCKFTIVIIANLHAETCLNFFIQREDISWEYKRAILNTLQKHITYFYPVYLSWLNIWNIFFHNFLSSLVKIVFSIIKESHISVLSYQNIPFYTRCLKVMCNSNINWFEKQIECNDFTKDIYDNKLKASKNPEFSIWSKSTWK